MLSTLWLVTLVSTIDIPTVNSVKLIVIYAEGLGGSSYYKYAHLPAFAEIEKSGVWSDLLQGVFPTQPLPTMYSFATGRHPVHHGFVADSFYSKENNEYFLGGDGPTDLQSKWWMPEGADTIWRTMRTNGGSASLLNWPRLCQVPGLFYNRPDNCTDYDQDYDPLQQTSWQSILSHLDTSDAVFVYDDRVKQQALSVGLSALHSTTYNSVHEIHALFDKCMNLAKRQRLDLNVLLISGSGLVDVAATNERFLEDYINMDWVNITIGYGAIKHIIPMEGKEDLIFDTLRKRAPIPQVKIYRTAGRRSDLPTWYTYYQSERIAPLILVAQPGFTIRTKHSAKQQPPATPNDYKRVESGYNNQFPDMRGLLLAYGPAFRRGVRAPQVNLLDLHKIMCRVLQMKCPKDESNIRRVDEMMQSTTRQLSSGSASTHLSTSRNLIFVTIFMFCLHFWR